MNYESTKKIFNVSDNKLALISLNISNDQRKNLAKKLSFHNAKYYSKSSFISESGLSKRIVDDLFASPTFPTEKIQSHRYPVVEEWNIILYFSIQRNWYTIQNTPCIEKPYPTNYALIRNLQDFDHLWSPYELYLLNCALEHSFKFLKANDVACLMHISLTNAKSILNRSDMPTLKIGGSIYIEKHALINCLEEENHEKIIL
ncbi:MAG: hypothetical protein RSB11_05905 [Oscillospiraceae bacterium]